MKPKTSRNKGKHLTTASRREVADRLHSAAIHLLRTIRHVDPESGLSPARLSALSVLVFSGPRTLGELARAEQVKPPTMSRLVDGLEADGLARRKAGTKDLRQVRVEPTAKGRRILERSRRRRIHAVAELLASLANEDVAVLGKAADLVEHMVGTALPARRRAGRS